MVELPPLVARGEQPVDFEQETLNGPIMEDAVATRSVVDVP